MALHHPVRSGTAPNPLLNLTQAAQRSVGAAGRLGLLEELAEHVVQDAAVAEVVDLIEGVDLAPQRRLLARAAFAVNGAGDVHSGLDAACESFQIDRLRPVELQGLSVLAVLERERQHA